MRSAVDEQPDGIMPESEGTETSETEAGEGILVDAEEFHADTLYDVSNSGINKIKDVGDVFAGRVEQGIVKPSESFFS